MNFKNNVIDDPNQTDLENWSQNFGNLTATDIRISKVIVAREETYLIGLYTPII